MTDLAFVAVGMVAATQQGPTDISFAATPDILRREEALISAMAYAPVARTSPVRPTRIAPERFNPVQVTPYSVRPNSVRPNSVRPNSVTSAQTPAQTAREFSRSPEFSHTTTTPTVASVPTSTAEAAMVQRMAAVSNIPVRPAQSQPQFSDRPAIQVQAAYSQVRDSQPSSVRAQQTIPQPRVQRNLPSHVRPTDWAYRSATYLVNRYNCGSEGDRQTLTARQALTRQAFARHIDTCLNQVTRLAFAGSSPTFAAKDDLAVVQALQRQFRVELAAARPIPTVPSYSSPVSTNSPVIDNSLSYRVPATARMVARQVSPAPTNNSRINSLPSREAVWTTFRY